MSIEDLMKVEVTSVSRKEQALSDVPAAVTVVSGDDIRRTGSQTIADALRMVPGMNVARLNANTWAVSARGFGDVFSNKLDVRMDGRSAYSPLFSGVYWDTFDTFLVDIDRIEVIRGPGGSLWGANAVNGVVSVMTKSSKETQGLYVYGGGGTELQGMAGARYGGEAAENLYYRAYVKYEDWDEGWKGGDPWWQARAGFRTDWIPNSGDTVTLQGDVYQGVTHQTSHFVSSNPPFGGSLEDAIGVDGGTVRGRWEHHFSKESNLSFQASFDEYRRDSELTGEKVSVAEVDFQHRFPLPLGQDVVWGAGLRNFQDHTTNSFTVGFIPDHRKQNELTAFLQDEIPLYAKALSLTVGSKFDHNVWTGFEYQPSVRMVWKVTDKNTVWASASRAVRIPARTDENLQVVTFFVPPFPPPATQGLLLGSPGMLSEHLTALELGYRVEPADTVSFDLALFHNWYERLRGMEPGAPTLSGGTLLVPLTFSNNLDARTYGVELAGRWRVLDRWTLSGSYSLLRLDVTADPSSGDTVVPSLLEGQSPRHQVYLRSTADLADDWHFDVIGRIVSRLPSAAAHTYGELDTRLAWDVLPNVQAAVVGQNLAARHHPEFTSQNTSIQPTDVERGGYIEVSVRF